MGSRIRGGRLKGASRGPLGLAVEATSNVANEGRPLKETSCVISSEQSCTGMCFYDSCAVFSCPNPLTAVVRLHKLRKRQGRKAAHQPQVKRIAASLRATDWILSHCTPLLFCASVPP